MGAVHPFDLANCSDVLTVRRGAFKRDPATVAFVRGLYPNAKKVIVDSDHQIQSANPEVVARAIADIIGTR